MFTDRLGYKAAAIFFALVLWLVVSGEEPSEELVEVRFTPRFTAPGVYITDDSLPVIHALVTARKRDLLKLYSAPPHVHRTFGLDTPDTVTLELRPADIELPTGVEGLVRDVQPRAVVLHFAQASKTTARITRDTIRASSNGRLR